jgi:ferritin-like metal-binding protein YciE
VPQMTSPRELFVHELKDVYYAEQAITKALPELASEASDRELTKAFQHHLDETRKQVRNLEQVFRNIGQSPQGEQCPGIDGIKEEHDSFMQENDVTSDVRDMFLTGAAARTEHYEIAAYTGLIGKARALGERDSVKLLQENLKQEKEALKTVESISKRMLQDAKSQQRGRSNGGSRQRAK